MGAIAFSSKPEHSWVKAGWVLRQVLDDTASRHPEDSEMVEQFNAAKAIDGLMVYLLRPELEIRITVALREVATGILSGGIQSNVAERHRGDEKTVAQYKEALRQLLDIIPTPGTPARGAYSG
jgi:hypothetical protein